MITIIREATLEDLPAICVLGQEVSALHYQVWPQIFAPPSDPSRDAPHWRPSIAAPDATIFIAEWDGQSVGFITVAVAVESDPILQPIRSARIDSVCVAAQLRSHGIGRLLMARAEQWAIERGATDVRLNVWAFNERALRLYEDELGYTLRSHFLGKTLSHAV